MNLHPLFILLLFAGLASCSPTSNVDTKAIPIDSSAFLLVAEGIGNGDLAFRKGNDITSNMLAQLNTKDKRFSHIGICFIEDGKKIIYHSLGSEYGGAQYIRRDVAKDFLDLENNLSIGYAKMDFSAKEKQDLHQLLQTWYLQKIPFDMNFNLATDDSLYCSEMVAKALMKAVLNIRIPFTDTLGRQYFGVDDISQQDFVDSIHFYSRSIHP